MDMYAVIRLKGSLNKHVQVLDTLKMLGLKKVNACSIHPKNPSLEGMLKKAKTCITWGEIDHKVLEKLASKRGKMDDKKMKEFLKSPKGSFGLSPPSKGLKSIKKNYPKGDLGYRGKEINSLLERMI